ncbi:hypothetical protein [Streptomyces chrestomyceticus]|uniref:hypothetical protein n=1 Tax=Streptomyces chrestomyceticus TaxID=68185 RepID=UPI0037A49E18
MAEAPSSPAATTSASVPRARAAAARTKRWGKIAQRTVPHDLKPEVLRTAQAAQATQTEQAAQTTREMHEIRGGARQTAGRR